MRLSLHATFFTIALAIAFAQDPLPQFEVATVKSPGPQDRIITRYNYPGGRVVISLYTFALLLHEALGVQRFQVVGAPAWIDSERFMIEAKPPASSKLELVHTVESRSAAGRGTAADAARATDGSIPTKIPPRIEGWVVYVLAKGPNEPKFGPPKHPEYRMFFAGLLGGGNGTASGGNATMEFIA